jgi:DNA mismatch endonuclease (patch repair protein)
MTDIVDTSTRSRMMSGIRGKNTKPELLIRSILHCRGFRFRLHASDLPGKPDLVLPRYGAVIFVHGCFWHGHDCSYFKWPESRPEFWREKIGKNRANDLKSTQVLSKSGWRTLIIWECATRPNSSNSEALVDRVDVWLHSGRKYLEISGKSTATTK